jgi:hypothetical protein
MFKSSNLSGWLATCPEEACGKSLNRPRKNSSNAKDNPRISIAQEQIEAMNWQINRACKVKVITFMVPKIR